MGFFKRGFCNLASGGQGLERGVGEGLGGRVGGKGWGGLGFRNPV